MHFGGGLIPHFATFSNALLVMRSNSAGIPGLRRSTATGVLSRIQSKCAAVGSPRKETVPAPSRRALHRKKKCRSERRVFCRAPSRVTRRQPCPLGCRDLSGVLPTRRCVQGRRYSLHEFQRRHAHGLVRELELHRPRRVSSQKRWEHPPSKFVYFVFNPSITNSCGREWCGGTIHFFSGHLS